MAAKRLPYDAIIAVSGCLALGQSGGSYYVFDQSKPLHDVVAGPYRDTVSGLAEMRARVARNESARPIVEYDDGPYVGDNFGIVPEVDDDDYLDYDDDDGDEPW